MIDTITNAMGKRSMAQDEKQQFISDALGSYSAKAARAGKDIGKPGKGFQAIENKYPGGKGQRIAGAVLAKLRAKQGG
jgi:hypothetical protein